MSSVEFRNITKKYGALTVLENLNLKVEDGEFVVLLGPSGCGKTSLLNILAGLLEVDSGEIYIGGREVSDLDPKDRGLAMVFQSYALYPTKSVRGNLKFGLSARKLSSHEIERRITWAANLLSGSIATTGTCGSSISGSPTTSISRSFRKQSRTERQSRRATASTISA
jgi:multiple sugar transport system ATP-binding protein